MDFNKTVKRDGMLEGVNLKGDIHIDCEELANSSDNQWRWLSFPESRMVVNPWDCRICDANLTLNIGLLVNGVQKCEQLQRIQLGKSEEAMKGCMRCKTIWYPHKLTAIADYDNGAEVIMTEFFADQHTFIRLYEIYKAQGQMLTISGNANHLHLENETGKVIQKDYGCSMGYQVLVLSDNGQPVSNIVPQKNEDGWVAEVPICESRVLIAFVLTLSVTEDECAIIECGNRQSLFTVLEKTKAFWNLKLSAIPAPTQWGITHVDAKGVTPFEHKRAFYAAWVFVYQNIMEPTPETGYLYPQITLGKASLWPNGSPNAPNSCSWESMFCIQEMALLEPELAWEAAAGFINDIGEDGYLGGESLPSQKAHMVWCCYVNLQDKPRLSRFYEKIKKYLLWRFENPRWIFGAHDYRDEKDISFVAEWYSDLFYAMKICTEIHENNDIFMWKRLKTEMDKNLEKWFFIPDPEDASDKIYNSFFSNSGKHYAYDRTRDVDNYICSLLWADIPAPLEEKLKAHYIKMHNPAEDLVGLDFCKYGDACHTAYGLLKKSNQDKRFKQMWREFINAAMRNVIKTGHFSEECHPDCYEPFGVVPSSFGASTIIDFTYLNNGVRIDSGVPTSIYHAE